MTNLEDLKRSFLKNEFLTLTISGALAAHSDVYSIASNDSRREGLRKRIRERLPQLEENYVAGQISEEDHVRKIQCLAGELTTDFKEILYAGRFRLGTAQKLLNLYLKYCWSVGWNPEPPHCPFDGRIIKKLSLPEPINWTELELVEDYWTLVEAARKKAAPCSIAVWELKEWP